MIRSNGEIGRSARSATTMSQTSTLRHGRRRPASRRRAVLRSDRRRGRGAAGNGCLRDRLRHAASSRPSPSSTRHPAIPGRLVVETIFRLDTGLGLQRRPDLAFVSYERWPTRRPAPEDGLLGGRARPGRRGRQPDRPRGRGPARSSTTTSARACDRSGSSTRRHGRVFVHTAPKNDHRARRHRHPRRRRRPARLPAPAGRPVRRTGRATRRPDRRAVAYSEAFSE